MQGKVTYDVVRGFAESNPGKKIGLLLMPGKADEPEIERTVFYSPSNDRPPNEQSSGGHIGFRSANLRGSLPAEYYGGYMVLSAENVAKVRDNFAALKGTKTNKEKEHQGE